MTRANTFNNPFSDTSTHLVEMSDDLSQELFANGVAKSMYPQIESDGHYCQPVDEILEHKKDGNETPASNEYITLCNDIRVPKIITR